MLRLCEAVLANQGLEPKKVGPGICAVGVFAAQDAAGGFFPAVQDCVEGLNDLKLATFGADGDLELSELGEVVHHEETVLGFVP